MSGITRTYRPVEKCGKLRGSSRGAAAVSGRAWSCAAHARETTKIPSGRVGERARENVGRGKKKDRATMRGRAEAERLKRSRSWVRNMIGGGRGGARGVKPERAFDVCWEVYKNAREVLESKRGISALKWTEATKFLWRPDIRPRLNEFVADFAVAGQFALADASLASRMVLFRLYYLG